MKRKSGIELLRILLIIFVILEHYVNPQVGGGLAVTEKNLLNHNYLLTIFCISICAVNIFIIISGYFLSMSQKRSFRKIIDLILQVIIVRELVYIGSALFFNQRISFKQIVMKLIPNNYFLILYIVLFVVSPFINILLNVLNRNNLKKLIILLFSIFSVYAILTDIVFNINHGNPIYISPLGIDGNQKGYTIMNFILLYLIGALIRKKVIQIRNRKIIVVGIVGMSVVLFVWAWIAERIGINDSAAFNYDNPIVIIIAALFFMAFKDLKFESKIINNLAQPVFMIFLINIPLLKLAKINIYANKSIVILTAHLLISTVIIYFIGYIVYRVYFWTIGKLLKKIKWFNSHNLVIKQ